MKGSHLVVASVSNTPEAAWLAQLLTFSCSKVQRAAPCLIVRPPLGPLLPALRACRRAGAVLVRSFDYGRANLPSSLSIGSAVAEDLGLPFVVVTAVDTVHASPASWPLCAAYDSAGIPFVAPTAQADRLGRNWWALMEKNANAVESFVLAAQPLGLSPVERAFTQPDFGGDVRPVIDLSIGSRTWSRDWFREGSADWPCRWSPPLVEDAGPAELVVRKTIHEAREFYEAIA